MTMKSRFTLLALATLIAAPLLTAGDPDVADAQASKTPPPSCTAAEHHQFDFWIGDWSVTTPDGKPAGTNRIESVAGGCGLLENWKGAGGGNGKSVNFWSPDDHQWHQTWVGSGGSFLFLAGEVKDGSMVMTGTNHPGGPETDQKITWTPLADGTVRQHWEQSTDGGTTWTDAFVGIYRHKK